MRLFCKKGVNPQLLERGGVWTPPEHLCDFTCWRCSAAVQTRPPSLCRCEDPGWAVTDLGSAPAPSLNPPASVHVDGACVNPQRDGLAGSAPPGARKHELRCFHVLSSLPWRWSWWQHSSSECDRQQFPPQNISVLIISPFVSDAADQNHLVLTMVRSGQVRKNGFLSDGGRSGIFGGKKNLTKVMKCGDYLRWGSCKHMEKTNKLRFKTHKSTKKKIWQIYENNRKLKIYVWNPW